MQRVWVFPKVLGFLLTAISVDSYSLPVRDLIIDRSLIRSRSVPLTPYRACSNVRALLSGAMENYSDSAHTLVMADAMEEFPFAPVAAPHLVRSQSWTTHTENANGARGIIRARAAAVREMGPAIRNALPESYNGPVLLSRGIVVGGEVTPEQLTRRNFPFRDFSDSYSALRIVEYAQEQIQAQYHKPLRWLEVRGYTSRIAVGAQPYLIGEKELVHLGYEDLYVSEDSVNQLRRLRDRGRLKSAQSLRELTLDNVMFSTVETYLDFLGLFPNVEVLTLSSISVHPTYPYVFIQPRNQGYHATALRRRCEEAMAETDFGTLFPKLKVIRLQNMRQRGDQADLESYLFPRTPYQHLEEIDLEDSNIDRDFMRLLTNLVKRTPSIRRLDLANAHDSGFDVDWLTAGVLKNLQELDVRYQFEGDIAAWLKRLPTVPLRRLWLDRIETVGDAELLYLVQSRKFADLYDLSVAETKVTAEGVKAIAKLRALQRFTFLDLSELKLGGTGAVVDLMKEGNLNGVTYLRLVDCGLTEADIQAIADAKLPHLDVLHLSLANSVTAERAREILDDYIENGVIIRIGS